MYHVDRSQWFRTEDFSGYKHDLKNLPIVTFRAETMICMRFLRLIRTDSSDRAMMMAP